MGQRTTLQLKILEFTRNNHILKEDPPLFCNRQSDRQKGTASG